MRLVVLTTVLLLAAGGQASAAVVATPGPHNGRELTGPPVLSNGVLTWMITECVWGCSPWGGDFEARFRVHVRNPGGRTGVLAKGRIERGGSGPNYWNQDVQFSASDTHLAVVRDEFGGTEDGPDYVRVAIRAGAFGQPIAELLRCQGFDSQPRLAVAGPRLAFDPAPCDENATVAVRDLDSGAQWELAEAGRRISALDMEGRYLAVTVSETPATWRVRVVDVDARTTLYEVDLTASPGLVAADVAADGSLATLTGKANPGCDRELIVWSPAGQARERRAACELVAHLADRTLFVAPDDLGRGIWELPTGSSDARMVVRLWRIPLLGADSDGEELAWAIPNCSGGAALHLDDLATPYIDGGPPYCVGGFRLGRLLVDRDGRTSAVLRCPAGCNGRLTVRAGGRIAATRYFAIPNGHTPVRLRLRPWARARLAATGALRARGRVLVRHLDRTNHVGTRTLRIVRR